MRTLKSLAALAAALALSLPASSANGGEAGSVFSYYPEAACGDLSMHVDSWRALNVAWKGTPLLAEAGVLYGPKGSYAKPFSDCSVGAYALYERRASSNVPVLVERRADGGAAFSWRSYDEEWGVEQTNRAAIEADAAVFESELVLLKGELPASIPFNPVLLPGAKTGFKAASLDASVEGARVESFEPDGGSSSFNYAPKSKGRYGERCRRVKVESTKGAIEYLFSSSDEAFELSLISGEVWPHYHHVLGASGLLCDAKFKPSRSRRLVWRVEIRLPGRGEAEAPKLPALKPFACLNAELGRVFALFHPDESVVLTERAFSPSPLNGLKLRAKLVDYAGKALFEEERAFENGAVRLELGKLPAGAYALSCEASNGEGAVGFDVTRIGVVPRLEPYPGEKSFFGNFQCYEPLVPEKILLNKLLGVGMIRFRDGRNGEFWLQSEPKAGAWNANKRGQAIAAEYAKAGLDMYYTGDQFPPSTVEFSSNDKKLEEPFPAGLKAEDLEFFNYHSNKLKDGFLPKDIGILRAFVKRYFAQFPQIKRYEVMNEPVAEMDAEMAAKTLKAVASATKELNPEAKIQGVGVSSLTPDLIALSDKVLEKAGDAVDMLSYHHYQGRSWFKLDSGSEFQAPELLGWEEQTRQIAQVALKRGKPFCNSELSWVGCQKETWPDASFNDNERNSADVFARSYLLEKAGGAASVTLCFGATIRPPSLDYNVSVERGAAFLGMRYMVKPWAVAHAVLADLLEGAELLERVPQASEGARIFAFKGRRALWAAMWNYVEPSSLSLPFKPGDVELRRVDGSVIDFKGEALPLFGSPVYVVAKRLAEAEFMDGLRRAAIKPKSSLRIERTHLKEGSLESLTVVLNNRGESEAEGLRLGYRNANPYITPFIEKFRVPPGRHSFELPVRLASTTLMDVRMELAARDAEGNALYDSKLERMAYPSAKTAALIGALPIVKASTRPDFSALPESKPWDAAPWLEVSARDRVGAPSGAERSWGGPEDLSAKAKLMWDERFLYFKAVVRDDVHVNSQPEASLASWAGDAVQLAFDLKMDSSGSYNADDHEVNIALWNGKPVAWHRVPKGKAIEGGRLEAKRYESEKLTVYELAIPLEELSPWDGENPAGKAIKFNFVVNDDDGKEGRRTKWIGLSDGIAETKNPALYKSFLFLDPAAK